MNIDRVGVELWSGAESMGYELTSDAVSITVADLGAHLASVIVRLDGNEEQQLTVGYPAGATTSKGYHGASVGRYANRIAGARFELDGVEYALDANEGENQLHGGPDGFAGHAWSADAEVHGDTGTIVLRHTSKDGDQGFPGKVKATAEFQLVENRITIAYTAKTSAPTPVNLTNHVYWNLGDTESLDGHALEIVANEYVEVDDHGIPLPGPPLAVQSTRFDCRRPRQLTNVIGGGGYDHCYVLDAEATGPRAVLTHESGRRVEVTTNQVGLQVYTGQHLTDSTRGIALETQALPDTPNRPDFGDSTLRPDDAYFAETRFIVS